MTILIGAFSVWPLVYLGIFFASFAYTWFEITNKQVSAEPTLFKYIFPLHCLTMLLMFALLGVYVFHAYKSDRIPNDKRVLWVVILFFGNMIAFPVYWYLYMWSDVQAASTPAKEIPPNDPAG